MQSGGASARTRKLAVPALVLVAHGVVLWSMAHRVPRVGDGDHPFDESRAVEVDIELQPRPKRPPPPLAPSPRPTPPPPSLAPHPTVTPPPGEATIPLPPATQPNVDTGKDEGVRRALGQVLGCNSPDAYGLTRDQRTDCFRKARPSAPLPQPFSQKEVEAFNADHHDDSIFVRHPTNGCLPRAGERAPPSRPSAGGPPIVIPGPAGSTKSRTTGGFGCAWSF